MKYVLHARANMVHFTKLGFAYIAPLRLEPRRASSSNSSSSSSSNSSSSSSSNLVVQFGAPTHVHFTQHTHICTDTFFSLFFSLIWSRAPLIPWHRLPDVTLALRVSFSPFVSFFSFFFLCSCRHRKFVCRLSIPPRTETNRSRLIRTFAGIIDSRYEIVTEFKENEGSKKRIYRIRINRQCRSQIPQSKYLRRRRFKRSPALKCNLKNETVPLERLLFLSLK